jgi:DNA (cytosine-5)-methyltransferase 1
VRYLSVCAGIEAATVAWHHMGWQAAGYSEIETFPSQVLEHHYPNVPKLGDMTKFKEWDIGAIDLLVGGTPCQSFSVAGLRKGMADPRGNLALTYCGILDHFKPNWFVWENVPGVLSSAGGRDFGSFLGAVGEIGYGFAYRVLDAQWFGVAQRRRRVFVVGCLGDWRSAAEVLFEPESLRWDLAPSREKGQKVAPTVVQGPPYSRTGNERVECDAIVLGNVEGGNATTLSAREYKGLSCGRDGMTSAAVVYGAQALRPSVQSHHAQVFVAQTTVYERHDQDARLKEVNVSPTLHAKSDNTCDLPVVLQPIPFDTTQITSPYNYSNPQSGDPCHPLATGAHPPAIVQPIGLDEEQNAMVNAFGTLKARTEGGGFEGTVMQTDMAVRRLTPTECERLQGFPDGYTDIQPNGKPTPDGPRYKALGNSMAVPVMKWIGERIEQQAKHKGAQTSCDH